MRKRPFGARGILLPFNGDLRASLTWRVSRSLLLCDGLTFRSLLAMTSSVGSLFSSGIVMYERMSSKQAISTLLDLTNLLLVSIYDISSFWVSDFVCSVVWFGGVHSK